MPLSSAPRAFVLLSLALAAARGQAGPGALELRLSLDHLSHRDDNVSRSIYSGMHPGVSVSYRSAERRSRFQAGFGFATGELSTARAGTQAFSTAGVHVTYLRRIGDDAFAGASVVGEALFLEHRYATGPSQHFLTSFVGLRPEVVLPAPALRNTHVRLTATLAAMIQRPYSRSKTGTFGTAALVGPDRWRDATVAIERSAATTARYSWRFGYQLRARAFDGTNGYAALQHGVYVTPGLRLGGIR